MAVLEKRVSGLLFTDDFSEPTMMWSIFPNRLDRVKYEDGSVFLTHSDDKSKIMYLIKQPRIYSMCAELYHVPTVKDDLAGIIVHAATNNYAQCETYHGDSIVTPDDVYKYIKLDCEVSHYDFFASKDGIEWDYVGNTELPLATRVGLFCDGPSSGEDSDLRCNRFSIYTNNKIQIEGVKLSQRVEIYDSNGVLLDNTYSIETVRELNKLTMNLNFVPLPIKNPVIKVYENAILKHVATPDYISGGDVYVISTNVQFGIDNNVVPPNSVYNLGNLYGADNRYVFSVNNLENNAIHNLKVRVEPYSEYYKYHEKIYLKDLQDGKFKREIVIPEILPNTPYITELRIKRDDSFTNPFMKLYQFKIHYEE